MSRVQKNVLRVSLVIAAVMAIAPVSNAMHIMEGYLPPMYCIGWGAISLPFVVMGFFSIKKTVEQNRKAISLLAIAGAFVFVISSLKIPSVTGSCSHMTGTGLGAILFGPLAVSVLGIIVLLFQALLLAHGGLTTLGANVFSMAIVGPFVAFGIYKLCQKLNVNKKVAVFLAACLGDFATYCITSFQLAIAYPAANGGIAESMVKFIAIFAPTQLPLAILEGVLTVIIVMGLEAFALPELKSIGYNREVRIND